LSNETHIILKVKGGGRETSKNLYMHEGAGTKEEGEKGCKYLKKEEEEGKIP
jgi:hypothetical protein